MNSYLLSEIIDRDFHVATEFLGRSSRLARFIAVQPGYRRHLKMQLKLAYKGQLVPKLGFTGVRLFVWDAGGWKDASTRDLDDWMQHRGVTLNYAESWLATLIYNFPPAKVAIR